MEQMHTALFVELKPSRMWLKIEFVVFLFDISHSDGVETTVIGPLWVGTVPGSCQLVTVKPLTANDWNLTVNFEFMSQIKSQLQ